VKLRSPLHTLCFLTLTALLLAGCGKPTATTAAPPAPEVGVVTVEARSLMLSTDLPGRTAAYRIAEVRPQVSGIVQKRLFTEGAQVKQGQQLYQIDAASYQAGYERARANLIRAERLARRYEGLMSSKAISQQQYDDAFASWKLAEADVKLAEIDLTYTRVLSPIAGRIGRSTVTEGALLTNGQPQALATVQQLDPIYVDVTRPVADLLRLQSELASGRLASAGDDSARATLQLEDGSEYPHDGVLQFSETTVGEGTGAVTLRAVFPNPDGRLLPGMFVHARLGEGLREGAILIPQQALQRDASGQATAWVIGADNKVSPRPVTAERTVGNHWLIGSGLEVGERVVAEGVQRLRPGTEVRAVAARNLQPVLDFGAPADAPSPGAAPASDEGR